MADLTCFKQTQDNFYGNFFEWWVEVALLADDRGRPRRVVVAGNDDYAWGYTGKEAKDKFLEILSLPIISKKALRKLNLEVCG